MFTLRRKGLTMGKTKKEKSGMPRTNLDLKRLEDGRYMDQYGRILEEYTNPQGKRDLRPVGIGYRSGNSTVPK